MSSSPPTLPTQVALLTPLGQGGIAVLHVVGPRAFELIAQVFRPRSSSPLLPDARRLLYGHIVEGTEIVDEVLVRLVPAADAPGGEPTAEVNCHGGVVAVQRVLDCFVRRGAEAVEPQALVERRAHSRHVGHAARVPNAFDTRAADAASAGPNAEAFGERRAARRPCRYNIEAEAALALVQATTALGVETLLDQLNGALEAALRAVPWDDPSAAAAALRRLLATERLGRALWQPPVVAIVGPANSGKSTLFNALAREERMIVSPVPGTTRDAVNAEVAIGGLPVWLTDTAGEREPDSAIEVAAQARSRSAAAGAALVVLLLDGSEPLPCPIAPAGAVPRLVVLNKADLGPAAWASGVPDAILISAERGDGLDALCRRIVETLVGDATYHPGHPVVFTAEQAAELRRALAALGSAPGRDETRKKRTGE